MAQRKSQPHPVSPSGGQRRLIAEPTTTLTDAVLMLQTFLYAYLLRNGPSKRARVAAAWSFTMACAGVAAMGGAITHALSPDSTAPQVRWVRHASWKIVGLSTALASGGLLVASLFSHMPAAKRTPYFALIASKTAAFATIAWISGNFLFTIIDYAISMLIVLLVELRNWRTSRAAPWLTAGVLFSFVAAGIQRTGIVLHRHLNYNDLYHITQMGAFHLLFEGARRQSDCRGKMNGTTVTVTKGCD